MPDTLIAPLDRANYLISHYWENFDFTDTVFVSLPEVTEQAFVDYIHMLPYAAKETALPSIQTTLASAEKEESGKMYAYFLALAEKYLYDTDSPFHNDEYYIPVVQYILSDSRSTEPEKVRPAYRLNQMLKNRVGETAADFAYALRSGKTGRLQEIQADYTLLLFYNPGCHKCEEVIEALESSSRLTSLQQNGLLQILSIYPGKNPIVNELYDLKMIPTLYLLDKDKKVLLKEVDSATIENWFNLE